MNRLTAARRCLQDELPDYAAGRMSPTAAIAWDRHVAVCDRCLQAVAAERRLQQAMTGAPSMPAGLLASLMQLAAEPGAGAVPPPPAPSRRIPVGFHLVATAPAPLPTLSPSAPPMHRSPVRTALVVGFAVGASAAAAWGLAGGSASLATNLGTSPQPATVIGHTIAPDTPAPVGGSPLSTSWRVGPTAGSPGVAATSGAVNGQNTAESRP